MLVDTHVHVSSPDTQRFPTLARPEGRTPWWVDPMPLDRMLGEMDRCGVDRVVLVHAFGAYGADNRYVLSVAGEAPDRAAAVYGVSMAAPGATPADAATPADLAARAAVRGVVGMRVLALGPDPGDDPWIDDGRADTVWTAAAGLGTTVIICARGSGLARLLPHVAAHPEVPVVLDDCGVPELDGDRVRPEHPVFAYSALPHVSVKLFSPMLLAAARQGSAGRLVDQVVGAFGAGRVAWGSNFPQSGVDYPTLVGVARDATGALGATDREAVLGATAERLWF